MMNWTAAMARRGSPRSSPRPRGRSSRRPPRRSARRPTTWPSTGRFYLGIERARALGAREVELVGDSELIVRQVRGEYRVKHAALRDLHARVVEALDGLERWSIRHVRREENERADLLVNEALDASAP